MQQPNLSSSWTAKQVIFSAKPWTNLLLGRKCDLCHLMKSQIDRKLSCSWTVVCHSIHSATGLFPFHKMTKRSTLWRFNGSLHIWTFAKRIALNKPSNWPVDILIIPFSSRIKSRFRHVWSKPLSDLVTSTKIKSLLLF